MTLENVILRGTETDRYVLSNNCGTIHLKGTTQVLATGKTDNKDNVAFDLWYGMSAVYDDGVVVYIDDPTVVIQGPIEFGHASRITDENQFLERTHLYVCLDYDLSKLQIPTGYVFVVSEDNPEYYDLRPAQMNEDSEPETP